MIPQVGAGGQYPTDERRLPSAAGRADLAWHDPIVLFAHVPRTAGTTFNGILSRQYVGAALLKLTDGLAMHGDLITVGSNPLDSLTAPQIGQIRAVSGHMGVGLHRLLSRPARYLTVLREPVARVASLYRYILGNPGHRFHAQIVQERLTLRDCLARPFVQFNNGQLRLLTGTTSRHVLGHGVDDPALVAQAKHMLDEQFDLVGTTDGFDDFLVLAWQRYRWNVPLYRRSNVSVVESAPLGSETVALAAQMNVMDLELYRYAEQRLLEAVLLSGSRFREHARLFALLNAFGGRT